MVACRGRVSFRAAVEFADGEGGMDWVRIVAGVLLALGGLGIAWYATRAVRALATMARARRERQHLLHRLDRLEAERRRE